MSREIKFRIWDDFRKEWLGATDNDVLTFYGFHLVGEVMTVQCPPQWALDPWCVVEQYTGLKDKSGKEIYEGDIVKFKNFNNKLMAGEIKYSTEDAMFRLEYTNNSGYQDWDYASRFKLEIIGNIHENSELLGGEE